MKYCYTPTLSERSCLQLRWRCSAAACPVHWVYSHSRLISGSKPFWPYILQAITREKHISFMQLSLIIARRIWTPDNPYPPKFGGQTLNWKKTTGFTVPLSTHPMHEESATEFVHLVGAISQPTPNFERNIHRNDAKNHGFPKLQATVSVLQSTQNNS